MAGAASAAAAVSTARRRMIRTDIVSPPLLTALAMALAGRGEKSAGAVLSPASAIDSDRLLFETLDVCSLRRKSPHMGIEYRKSACPHDCPSACSLEVERLSSTRIGRVRGAAANSYTDGVVCAKVARYAERVHHPDRLKQPLQRTGAKGSGSFRPISWDAALDEIAEAFRHAAQRHGAEAVWPYHSGGTMGVVQRWGIERLRHAMGYSRQ